MQAAARPHGRRVVTLAELSINGCPDAFHHWFADASRIKWAIREKHCCRFILLGLRRLRAPAPDFPPGAMALEVRKQKAGSTSPCPNNNPAALTRRATKLEMYSSAGMEARFR